MDGEIPLKFKSYLGEGDVIDIKGKLAQNFAKNLVKDVSVGFDMQNKAEADSKVELEKLKNSLKYAYSKVKIVGFKDISDMAYFLVNTNLYLSSSWSKVYASLVGVDRKKADFILEKGPEFIKIAEKIKEEFDAFDSRWAKKLLAKEYYAPVAASAGYIRHSLYSDIRIVKDFLRRVNK